MSDFRAEKQEILDNYAENVANSIADDRFDVELHLHIAEASKQLDQLYLEELLKLSTKLMSPNQTTFEAVSVEAIKELLS